MSWILVIVAGGVITWYVWPRGEASIDNTADQTLVQLPPEPTGTLPQAKPPVEPAPTPKVIPVEVEEIAAAPSTEIATVPEQPAVAPPPVAASLAATGTAERLADGLTLIDANNLTEARSTLTAALLGNRLTPAEVVQAKGVLQDLSERMIFSPEVVPGDTFAMEYIVRDGDTLSRLVQKMNLQVDWRFIQRINEIPKASMIRVGQNLKLVTGPFHAVIDKAGYRMDLFMGEAENRVFVASVPVGLGEYNSTPVGRFRVRRNSKLVNPTWINPRTRQSYAADDPENPIGERWIGLVGTEERTKDLTGLGIHGTIELESIGRDASMGCVRLRPDDVELVYEMLVEGVSTVEIR
jgi:lipoprotein-anchoring transpeptidase ErfK/SrfK